MGRGGKDAGSARIREHSAFLEKQYSSRWKSLLLALVQPTRHAAVRNKYCAISEEEFLSLVKDGGSALSEEFIVSTVLAKASILPVIALQLNEISGREARLLDLCSAPGGKAFLIAQWMDDRHTLRCNEIDDGRRERLVRVINEHVPTPRREQITVSGLNGTRLHPTNEGLFDRILIDAPCSSDRHLIHSPKDMAKWSRELVADNARRQVDLLSAALRCLRTGGRLVYATCALSQLENDNVIERSVKNSKGGIQAIDISQSMPFGEPTKSGWIILPDKTTFGPIYLCALERLSDPIDSEDSSEEECEM